MSPNIRKLDNGEIVPIGYHCVNCHIIFQVKMDYFRRKDMLVVGVHVPEPPATIINVNVVSRERFRIYLKLAALKDFTV